MNTIVKYIEKQKPLFEKISNNPYLRAIRDGFITLIPVILFSSLFLLIAYVPNIFAFYWSSGVEIKLMKAYQYSMGILGLFMAATVTKSLTDNFNGKLPKINQINSMSTMIAAMISFLLLGIDGIAGGISIEYMGTKGLLTAFVVGFIVPNIYYFCVKNNLAIKMPPEVPGNIAQTFKDLIPITISVLFFWLFDIVFRQIATVSFSEQVITIFQPIFSAADSYFGLALIFGAMAFFWFIGIHGPSIVEPAVAAIYITNVEANLLLNQQGEHAANVLAQGTQYFVATLGGTGATLMITLLFTFLARSKQLKAVGRSSSIPVIFGVNEPVLFGAPLVLNPVFFIPFIFTPIVNVWLFKFFIDVFNMNGFIYNLPWTTPAPLGLILGTGFATFAVFLAIILLIVDGLIYLPFFIYYDRQLVTSEQTKNKITTTKVNTTFINEQISNLKKDNKELAVLVLCANGATSSMLANAIKRGAAEKAINIKSIALAYGQHKDVIAEFDIIILAPQMSSMLTELTNEVQPFASIVTATTGTTYINLTKNPQEALNFVINLSKEDKQYEIS